MPTPFVLSLSKQVLCLRLWQPLNLHNFVLIEKVLLVANEFIARQLGRKTA